MMRKLLLLLALLAPLAAPSIASAATLNDTCLGADNTSGTTLGCADAIAVTSGDLVACDSKFEGATTTVTFDTGASTPTFSVANAVLHHATNNDLNGAVQYWIATSTGTVTPRFVLGAARLWRKIKCYSVTPAGGTTLELGNVEAAEQSATSSPSAGSDTSTAAGFSVTFFNLYGSEDLTMVGTGCNGGLWTEAAELNVTEDLVTQYCLHTSAQTLNSLADFAAGGSEDSVGQLAIFNEAAVGGGTVVPQIVSHRRQLAD